MSKRTARLYLEDILTSVERIRDYTRNLSKEDFYKNQQVIDAVVRNLEIIGEAARNIPLPLRKKHPQIPWSQMTSMRNKVIHEYSGIDLDILWQTIQEDLPNLADQIRGLADQI